MIRRVLLVGFMGSGKTHVGRALASRLGWAFSDFDEGVENASGLPIPEIFCQHGEAHFRELEGEVGLVLLQKEGFVLASGGGWPTVAGRMESLPEDTLTVWLKVSPEEAIRRAGKEGSSRPLLAVEDPLARARELLAQRVVHYEKADLVLDSLEGEPQELARRIEEMIAQSGRERLPSTSA